MFMSKCIHPHICWYVVFDFISPLFFIKNKGPFKRTESRRWQFLVNTMTVIWIQEVLGSLAPSAHSSLWGMVAVGYWYL